MRARSYKTIQPEVSRLIPKAYYVVQKLSRRKRKRSDTKRLFARKSAFGDPTIQDWTTPHFSGTAGLEDAYWAAWKIVPTENFFHIEAESNRKLEEIKLFVMSRPMNFEHHGERRCQNHGKLPPGIWIKKRISPCQETIMPLRATWGQRHDSVSGAFNETKKWRDRIRESNPLFPSSFMRASKDIDQNAEESPRKFSVEGLEAALQGNRRLKQEWWYLFARKFSS